MGIRHLMGKRVLVTGAASGIGRATALAFAGRGADLVLCDLDGAVLEPIRDAAAAMGVACTTHGVDVADEAAMQSFATAVHTQGGAIDILVNNTGIGYLGACSDTPIDEWHRSLGIEVMGVVHALRCFLPLMHDVGGIRRVVNVASPAGIAFAPDMSAYATSKSAVIGLSEAVSLELRLLESGVGITVICPDVPRPGAGPQALHEYNGVDAQVVAEIIVDAVMNGRDIVRVGPFAKPLYHLRRFARALLRQVLLVDTRNPGYC